MEDTAADRRARRVADERTQRIITAADSAATATAAAAADASDLALGLGGPAFASCAAIAAGRLARHVAAIGESFAAMADALRDVQALHGRPFADIPAADHVISAVLQLYDTDDDTTDV